MVQGTPIIRVNRCREIILLDFHGQFKTQCVKFYDHSGPCMDMDKLIRYVNFNLHKEGKWMSPLRIELAYQVYMLKASKIY